MVGLGSRDGTNKNQIKTKIHSFACRCDRKISNEKAAFHVNFTVKWFLEVLSII